MELRDVRHRQLLELLQEEDAANQPIEALLAGWTRRSRAS
jgi:hypothetical protein